MKIVKAGHCLFGWIWYMCIPTRFDTTSSWPLASEYKHSYSYSCFKRNSCSIEIEWAVQTDLVIVLCLQSVIGSSE